MVPKADEAYLEFQEYLSRCSKSQSTFHINLLKPNDIYICRNAALTPRRYILNIYSTNIHTEYFKRAAQSPFFFFKMPFIS